MVNYSSLLAVLCALFLFSCSESINPTSAEDEQNQPGDISLTIDMGKLGALAKSKAVELSKLYITL
ncbi:MAG: hypothetical protein GF350_15390, partial [Chitinivibrionales bacterium]|nr:hypothetical protein [Chitinivibrionales bacterium]